MNRAYQTVVVGGGLVGAAIACGIARRDPSVMVLDGSDRDFRASRGNFGLVWVQGKGADCPAYARLTAQAAQHWRGFADLLQQHTGVDVGLEQTGGYDFCLNPREWRDRELEMQQVARHTAGSFEYEMLDNAELRRRIPEVSPRVLGASYSPHDGHVNPLYLLRALHQYLQQLGGAYDAVAPVESIRPHAQGFDVNTAAGKYRCARLVLCAGLANQKLARQLEMNIPLHPLRGQLLITERARRFLHSATLQVRQTAEGSLQIGDSHEQVGYDDAATLDVIQRLAARAVRIFPHLRALRLQRAWGALRVMTPDGLPIYHRSPLYPGAFAISCHSGVTLAAVHADTLADWVFAGADDARFDDFSARRFDVSPA